MAQKTSQPTLYLMLGQPGSGKTTAAKALAEVSGAVHLSSDYVRLQLFPEPLFNQAEHDTLYRTLDYITELLLVSGVSVVYDANLNRREHREEKYDLARRLGVQARLIWVQVSDELARERALNVEDKSLRPFGPMPAEMFDKIHRVFEAPRDDEATVVLDGTTISESYVKSTLGL